MQVPYSMDDSEPDLHCGMGGQSDDQDLYSSSGGRDGGYGDPANTVYVPSTALVFASEEDMLLSEVYQRNLAKSLACKQRQIDELRQEILNMLQSKP